MQQGSTAGKPRKMGRKGPRGSRYQSYHQLTNDPDYLRWLAVPPMQENRLQHEFAALLSNRYGLDYRALWHHLTRQWTQHWTQLKGCAPYADLLPADDEMEMSW